MASALTRGVQLQVLTGALTTRPMADDLIADLEEAQVTHNAGQRSGFQLRFSLSRGSTLDRMLAGRELDPPARVILVVTVDGRAQVLSDGVVTRHDLARSSTAGASTLTLTGVDVSQMMDLIDLSGLPMPMPPEAQVLTLLAPFGTYGVVPMVIPSVLIFAPNPIERYDSIQGTPYAHLSRLADDVGYVFYVEPGPQPGMNTAYWGPEIRAGSPQAALTVDSDVSSNVESLSFSFDGIRKTVYVLTAFPPQVRVPIPIPVPDISPMSPPQGAKPIIPLSYKRMNIDRHSDGTDKNDDATARLDIVQTLARGLARAAESAQVVTGSGSLEIARYGRLLQARKPVDVRGAGPAYDGRYTVRSVTTTLAPGKASQQFSLARNAQVPNSGRVTP